MTIPPPSLLRPRTNAEQSPDLAHPHFSNCTIPVVFFLSYMNNAHEMFEKLFVVLWAAAQRDAWDKQYSIVFNALGQHLHPSLALLSSFHSNQPPVCEIVCSRTPVSFIKVQGIVCR